ncbi:phosphatase PAP2 family protein [Sphingobium sufflavum]|uniref:phosphatase PAP2 family protein n=1 Tax=Sphingobium sufflavum TaxID=1129547 RepID=UPI001F1C6837|nr:phosphatase PAP2 family protein [Sphingobium sufflavum]MCE7797189.1 phosphatase PAP2 family protein [Sphingobium sufflavum]
MHSPEDAAVRTPSPRHRLLALLSPHAHRIDSRMLVVFLIVAVGGFAFLKLASEVTEGDSLAIDRMLLRAMRSASDPAVPVGPLWLRRAMVDITALGGVSVLTLITALAAGYLVAARKLRIALFMTAAIAGGAMVSTLLKTLFARPRPDLVDHLVEVTSSSFPSGHAMNSAIIYLTLGALLARAQRDRRVRIYILSAAMALTLLIGLSRVYLGVHWPSDVMAGWCVGASWAALSSLVARGLQRERTIEAATSGP